MQKQGDIPKAVLLWGNSAVALMKAENYGRPQIRMTNSVCNAKTLSRRKYSHIQKSCPLPLQGKFQNQRALQIYALSVCSKPTQTPPQELSDIYAMQGDVWGIELYRPAASSYDKAIALLPAGLAPEAGAKMRTALGAVPWKLGDYEGSNPTLW